MVSKPRARVLLYFIPLTLDVNLSTALSSQYLLSPVICPLLSISLINLNTSFTGAKSPALPATPPYSSDMLFMTEPWSNLFLYMVGGTKCFSASVGVKEIFLKPSYVININISQVRFLSRIFWMVMPSITIPQSLQTHLEPVVQFSFQLMMQLVMFSALAGRTAGASQSPELWSNMFQKVMLVLLLGKNAGQYLPTRSAVWRVPLSYTLMQGAVIVNIWDNLPRSNLASIVTGGAQTSILQYMLPKFLVQRTLLDVATPMTPPGQQPLSIPSWMTSMTLLQSTPTTPSTTRERIMIFIPTITWLTPMLMFSHNNNHQQMFSESILGNLRASLSDKDSVIHVKALTIIDTIIASTQTQLQNQSQANVCLVILTLLYKQFKQSVEDQAYQNSTSYLILINHLLPHVNTASLDAAGVLQSMKQLTTRLLNVNNRNFLAFRYCLSVMTELVIVSKEESRGNKQVLTTLLEIALKSTKSIERREAGKNLKIILDRYPNFGLQLATETKTAIDDNISSTVYVHSIKPLAGFFPSTILNDICYKLKQALRGEDQGYNEDYAVETYFFLDAVMEVGLVTGDIAEEILKELIHNIPLGGNHRIIYGYLQCIDSSFLTLNRVNPNSAQRYLASAISVVSEVLLSDGKIAKQASSVLKELVSQGVTSSLWQRKDTLDLEDLELDSDSNSFGKVRSMLQDLLSTRYEQRKTYVVSILTEFISRLDESAFEASIPFILELVRHREQFQVSQFSQLFGTVMAAFGHESVLRMLPLSIKGDPTAESFQADNNLWLLDVLAKHSPPGCFQVFISIIFPLLIVSQQLRVDPQQNRLRQAIYHEISHRFWATLSNLYLSEGRLTGWEECIQYIESNLVDKYDQLTLVLNGFIHILTHLETNVKYFSSKAQKLIPNIARMLDLSNQKQASNVLRSIVNLSKVCNPEYLQRVFLKNLTKLLSQKQNGTLMENEATNTKNIEILIAISHGVNFNDPSVVTLDGQQLSKLQCVAYLLDQLISEQNVFQKKAYKYMMQCFTFMPEQFLAVVQDLIDKTVEVLPFSRSYRLASLHALWNYSGFSEETCNVQKMVRFTKEYLAEIMLMLKEPNHKVRKLSHGLMCKILKTMGDFGIIESFLETMSSGLTSVSASGKVDIINSLTLSLGSLDVTANADFAKELTQVVIVLLQESKPDVLKSVINYLKKYIFLFPSSKTSLPDIMRAIFETDDSSRLHILHVVKRLLLKLVKRDSKETIMKIIPTQHQRLLKSMMRQEGKKKRQQRKRQLDRKIEPDRNDVSSDDEEAGKDNNYEMIAEEQVMDEKKRKNNMLIKYDLDEERFHFVDGKRKASKPDRKAKAAQEQDQVAFIDGKLIVRESGGKRMRPEPVDEEEKEVEEGRAPRKIVKVSREVSHQVKQSGSTYKAARAKGDLQIKNKPQPHAFIQLNPKVLNKRYKQKADKVFQNFFSKKEGGLKGLKMNLLSKRK